MENNEKTQSIDIEKIKEEWGYKGKPKQWQQGFDAGMKELIEQLSKNKV